MLFTKTSCFFKVQCPNEEWEHDTVFCQEDYSRKFELMINRGLINTTINETYCCERKIPDACKKCVKDLVDGKVEVEKSTKDTFQLSNFNFIMESYNHDYPYDYDEVENYEEGKNYSYYFDYHYDYDKVENMIRSSLKMDIGGPQIRKYTVHHWESYH